MLMKRFVGGGNDWCIHMDAMVMVRASTLTICWVLNKKGGGFVGYDENTTIKLRYIISGARLCWITQGGWGDWQREAKGAMVNTMRRGGGGGRREMSRWQSMWGKMEASDTRRSSGGWHGKRMGVEDMQQCRGAMATTMMMTMRINLCSGNSDATILYRPNIWSAEIYFICSYNILDLWCYLFVCRYVTN
jgi:hypothetical protein